MRENKEKRRGKLEGPQKLSSWFKYLDSHFPFLTYIIAIYWRRLSNHFNFPVVDHLRRFPAHLAVSPQNHWVEPVEVLAIKIMHSAVRIEYI